MFRPGPFSPFGALAFAVLLCACGGREEPRVRVSQGGRHYGGIFNINEVEEVRSLFPLSLTQAAAHRIGAQVYQGLVRFDQGDLTVQPCVAASWEVDASGTRYTFRLRDGVRFHDDACFPGGRGRAVTARDVVRCFTAICTADEGNQMFWLFQDRVLGANAHYAATAKGTKPEEGVKGIELLDDRTVRITLLSPWPNFLQVLAHQGCWIWPGELVQHYGRQSVEQMVGTGPFRVNAQRTGEVLVLERNPGYWEVDEHGDALPYLDGVRYTFGSDKRTELERFMEGKLSMVYELPVDATGLLQENGRGSRFQVQTMPSLSVQFYGFNASRPPFSDPRVRRAFALAVDRERLVADVLGELAFPARHGMVAPGLPGYPYGEVEGVPHDPQLARSLLAEAGYPGGAGFPLVLLQVNSTGYGYVQVASEVQAMLEKVLGVQVATSVLPAQQHFDRVERGVADLWREGWIADHPDAENFLALFYGRNAPEDPEAPSYLNTTRFRDAHFDSLFQAASVATDEVLRKRLLAAADARLMEELPALPLYHERSVRLLQPWVRDLPINGLEYRDLTRVWFDPTARKER
jgi:peptide/nickel transport system substrate-binding protein